jgi:hypothetical protein
LKSREVLLSSLFHPAAGGDTAIDIAVTARATSRHLASTFRRGPQLVPIGFPLSQAWNPSQPMHAQTKVERRRRLDPLEFSTIQAPNKFNCFAFLPQPEAARSEQRKAHHSEPHQLFQRYLERRQRTNQVRTTDARPGAWERAFRFVTKRSAK